MEKLQSKVILELTKKLGNFFGPGAEASLSTQFKFDKSFITEIDIFVSELIKKQLLNSSFQNYTFFSEEDFDSYHFPAAILDPIDGTRELIKGFPECAVSLALMNSATIADPLNMAWIYNPFSGFSLDSRMPFTQGNFNQLPKFSALVSRSEFEKGLYQSYLNNELINIAPRGSIAFKLALLASGSCDFVISLVPKNVWDIAAGTILCSQRGIHFYQNGKKVNALESQLYGGVLLWCHEDLKDKIMPVFQLN